MNDVEQTYWLSLLVFAPIATGFGLLWFSNRLRPDWVKVLSMTMALFVLATNLFMLLHFDPKNSAMQFVEIYPWIATGLGVINYHLGVDGISLPLLLLNNLITIALILTAWNPKNLARYHAIILLMAGLFNGIFCALDGVLFYVFFEVSLIPLYLMIGLWGGANRVYAAMKFFLFTLLGSLPMLAAFLYLYFVSGASFDIQTWHEVPLSMTAQTALFFALLLGFAVKVPMWPVHTWLPDAHVEAPTEGSMVLAAVALKLGTYGFMRFLLPIVPNAVQHYAFWVIIPSLIAVVYIGFVALVQKDMKKLVAYSSIAHMGFVTLGCVIFTGMALEGAMVQMLSHGFISAAMFMSIGILYHRMHTRDIDSYGGVIHVMPKFAAFMVFFAMANAGLPGTSGFVGEFMVAIAAIKFNPWVGLIASTTIILAAAYSLWLVKRVIYGEITNPKIKLLHDIDAREFSILLFLAIFVLLIGIYPNSVTYFMHSSIENLIQHIQEGKLLA